LGFYRDGTSLVYRIVSRVYVPTSERNIVVDLATRRGSPFRVRSRRRCLRLRVSFAFSNVHRHANDFSPVDVVHARVRETRKHDDRFRNADGVTTNPNGKGGTDAVVYTVGGIGHNDELRGPVSFSLWMQNGNTDDFIPVTAGTAWTRLTSTTEQFWTLEFDFLKKYPIERKRRRSREVR